MKFGVQEVIHAAIDLTLDGVYSAVEYVEGLDLFDKKDNEISQIIQSKLEEFPTEAIIFSK